MSKLAGLQILRGIAASLVVVDHTVLRHAEWADYPPIADIAAPYSGTIGVGVFFVISGFIMVHTAGDQFGRPGGAASFLQKRLVRIVPLYWAATALEIGLRLHKGGSSGLGDIVASLLFIPLPVVPGDYMRPVLGVGWTLNYEMFFYLIFAISLLFRRPIGLSLLFGTLCGLVAFGAIYKPLADTSPPHTLLAFWTDPIILLFAGGVLTGLATKAAGRRISLPHPVPTAVALLAIFAAAFVGLGGTFPIPLGWLVSGWATCILAVGLCTREKPAPAGIVRRAGIELGEISYALYLFHFFAVVAAEKIWWLLFGRDASILFIPAAYLVAVAAAYAIHHLLEVGITRWLTPPSTVSGPAPESPSIGPAGRMAASQPAAPEPAQSYGRK